MVQFSKMTLVLSSIASDRGNSIEDEILYKEAEERCIVELLKGKFSLKEIRHYFLFIKAYYVFSACNFNFQIM